MEDGSPYDDRPFWWVMTVIAVGLMCAGLFVACAPASTARGEPIRRVAGVATPEVPKHFVVRNRRDEQDGDWPVLVTIRDTRTGYCWLEVMQPGYNGQPPPPVGVDYRVCE